MHRAILIAGVFERATYILIDDTIPSARLERPLGDPIGSTLSIMTGWRMFRESSFPKSYE